MVRISWLWHYIHYLSIPLYSSSGFEPFWGTYCTCRIIYDCSFFSTLTWFHHLVTIVHCGRSSENTRWHVFPIKPVDSVYSSFCLCTQLCCAPFHEKKTGLIWEILYIKRMKILLIEERKKHLKEDFLINMCTIFWYKTSPESRKKLRMRTLMLNFFLHN